MSEAWQHTVPIFLPVTNTGHIVQPAGQDGGEGRRERERQTTVPVVASWRYCYTVMSSQGFNSSHTPTQTHIPKHTRSQTAWQGAESSAVGTFSALHLRTSLWDLGAHRAPRREVETLDVGEQTGRVPKSHAADRSSFPDKGKCC